MAAPVSFSREFGDLLTHTADKIFGKGMFQDAVFDAYPTFNWMKEGGKVETVSGGGALIRTDLMYAKANSVKPYSSYEELEITPSEGFTSAFYDYSQYHGPLVIDGMSKFKNAGAEKIADLVASKSEQLAMTFADEMNADLFDAAVTSDANRGKAIYSLRSFMQDDPTADLDVGKINQSTYDWWRNETADGSGFNTGELFVGGIRNMHNNLGKTSGGKPQVLIVHQDIYEDFEAWLDTRVQYVQTNEAGPGFEKIKYKNLKLWFDDDIASGVALMINPQYLKLVQAKGMDFKPTPFERPVNQDAYIANAFWYGQLICSNRRKLGVIHSIPAFT